MREVMLHPETQSHRLTESNNSVMEGGPKVFTRGRR